MLLTDQHRKEVAEVLGDALELLPEHDQQHHDHREVDEPQRVGRLAARVRPSANGRRKRENKRRHTYGTRNLHNKRDTTASSARSVRIDGGTGSRDRNDFYSETKTTTTTTTT